MQPALNFAECEALAHLIRPELVGLQVEKVLVVQRKYAEGGFFKNEWALRLSAKGRERRHLILSVRAQNPYLYVTDQDPTAAQATQSGFALTLNKSLPGAVLRDVRAIPGERFILLDFDRMGILLSFIPQMTEAFLVVLPAQDRTFTVISRSKVEKISDAIEFTLPAARPVVPGKFTVRADFPASPVELQKKLERGMATEALDARILKLERELKQRRDQLELRLAECRDSWQRASHEPDYDRCGNLLKGSHYLPETQVVTPTRTGFERRVMDFTTEEWVSIPVVRSEKNAEPTVTEDIEKFFQLAKRKKRKLEENHERITAFEREVAAVAAWQQRLGALDQAQRLKSFEAIAQEWKLHVSGGAAGVTAQEQKQSGLKKTGWKGKVFRSQEGMLIFAGRNKIENLDLTFKLARGNDLWLHVKSKPGAHVVISLPAKKSASLETLLDAALLCVYYSGGASWGKCEVDYTFAKYVKRIKNSTEASYTQQKTLSVQFDEKRWERLQKSELVL